MLVRKPARAISLLLVSLLIGSLYFSGLLHIRRDYYMSLALSTRYSTDPDGTHRSVSVCEDSGFKPYRDGRNRRKVYDLVLFSTELDWLEIRLHQHGPYVDWFVIIESPTTFSGLPKPLILKANWDRFKEFHSQIIYRVVEDPIKSTRTWDHEDFFRNALLREVFPTLTARQQLTDIDQRASRGDAMIVSDMDELLRPGTLLLLRHCDFPARLTLRSQFYYYSFQWLHRGQQWSHPEATVFGSSVGSTLAPNDLRMNLLGPGWKPLAAYRRWRDRATLWDAGWHCSSCFRTIGEVQAKMQSFSHQSWNTEANREPRVIAERVNQGLDLFGREGENYVKVLGNGDVPGYVRRMWEEEGRFQYLIARSGESAGFEDWNSVVHAAG